MDVQCILTPESLVVVLRLVHYILYAMRHDQKSLFFQWALTCRHAGIELGSIPVS